MDFEQFEDMAIAKYEEEEKNLLLKFRFLKDSSVELDQKTFQTFMHQLNSGAMKWSPFAYIGLLLDQGITPHDIRRIIVRRLEKYNLKDETKAYYYRSALNILDEFEIGVKATSGREDSA